MVIAQTHTLAQSPAAPNGKAARLWWLVHQWAGLKLSIFMSFILLTGTLAVFGHEMDWAMRPALRVDPASVSGPVDWPAIAEGIARAHPQAQIVSLEAPVDRGFAASAIMEAPDGRNFFAYAHPTTGAYRGEGDWVGAQRILRNMHRHLNLPTKIGVPIVSALSFLLLVSLATSFVVYKKWWRGFFRPVRSQDARTAWGDVHRLAGVWSLWFCVLMILTGLWYLAESLGAQAKPFANAKAAPVEIAAVETAAHLAPALRAAQAAFPALRLERIVFPTKKNGAFEMHGQHKAILVRPRANGALVAAETAEVLARWDARDASVHQRISEMADPLHFGTLAGVWTKIIWFLFGGAMTALSVSGVAIYATRLAKAERRPPRWRRELVAVWHGMGWWRWTGLAALATAFILLPELLAQAGGG
jgi:uncharacterized iron-regulated membrane protein